MDVDYQAKVVADKGSTVNMRANPSTKADVLKAVRVGSVVGVEEEYNGEWAKINYENTRGYMMRKFLVPYTDSRITIKLEKDVALALLSELQNAIGA